MLTVRGIRRECRPGISRRDVLRVGALGLGSLALPEILRLQASAATVKPRGSVGIG